MKASLANQKITMEEEPAAVLKADLKQPPSHSHGYGFFLFLTAAGIQQHL